MRIALLNPPWRDPLAPLNWGLRAGSRWPHFQKRPDRDTLPRYIPFPFFLAIAARNLSNQGHDVLLIDSVAEGTSLESLHERVMAHKSELIFSEMSTPSLRADRDTKSDLREAVPDAMFAAGGVLDDSLAKQMLRENVVDFWLAGEYDLSLGQLAEAIDMKRPFKEVPGLIMAGGTENPRHSPDINKLPMPLHEQLPMYNYRDPVCGLPAPSLQTWLSRGCPYSCSFCVWPQLIYGNRKYRTRDIDRALDEIETLFGLYNFKSFYFDDDTANIGEDRMLELARKLKERGLDQYPWAMMARGDCMTSTMIDALAGAGMYSVKFGVESISPKLTNACGKNTNLPALKQAIANAKAAGVKVHLTFTFGLPGETVKTIRETVDFAIETAPESAQFSLCIPFPGTRFFEDCFHKGWLTTTDWESFLGNSRAVIETPQLSAADLETEYRAALERWRAFNRKRLDEKRQRLKDELKEAVAKGARWTLFGDPDFAEFLLEDEQLKSAFEPESDASSAVPVIVSRHHEERLWRDLAREQPAAAKIAVRLFG